MGAAAALRVEGFSALLGIPAEEVKAWIASGHLVAVQRDGRDWLDWKDVGQFLRQCANEHALNRSAD